MGLLDIFNSANISQTLGTFMESAKTQANNLSNATPGGVGGLLGAGAIGTLLGSFMSKGALQNVALVGAGAVAWNFYQKWAQSKKAEQAGQAGQGGQPVAAEPAALPAAGLDATGNMLLRAMVFAARADGHIDATEQQRIRSVVGQIAAGQDAEALIQSLLNEPIDPAKFTDAVQSQEQGDDLYRLSCMIVDIDHFMERSYLDALALALKIDDARKTALEEEARQAKAQIAAQM